jgi:hypothetical protein
MNHVTFSAFSTALSDETSPIIIEDMLSNPPDKIIYPPIEALAVAVKR